MKKAAVQSFQPRPRRFWILQNRDNSRFPASQNRDEMSWEISLTRKTRP
jgi:hypothetical protein